MIYNIKHLAYISYKVLNIQLRRTKDKIKIQILMMETGCPNSYKNMMTSVSGKMMTIRSSESKDTTFLLYI